jgi:hypothetical protein
MYKQRIDREHPTCVLFLLDQSQSMRGNVRRTSQSANVARPSGGHGRSKAAVLAEAINGLLYELVLRCIKSVNEGPRHYFDIGVVGYGASVGSAFSGPLAGSGLVDVAALANAPLRLEDRVVQEMEGTLSHKFPVWIEPVANNGTPMKAALRKAHELVSPWVESHQASFPPVVINITDGASTDGNPAGPAELVRGLKTEDGGVLLFNLNVSGRRGEPKLFPCRREELSSRYAKALFDMSSPLPTFMAELARARGLAVAGDARGFVFNADMASVVTFLQIGTSPAPNLLDG